MPKLRALIVDDVADMAETIANDLSGAGFETNIASDGAAALKQFAKDPADIVVTDLRMKGADGLDVLAGIKQADPNVPVIIMTAFGAVESAVEAIWQKRGLPLCDQAVRAGNPAFAGRARLPRADAVPGKCAAAADPALEPAVAAAPGEQPADAAAARPDRADSGRDVVRFSSRARPERERSWVALADSYERAAGRPIPSWR